MDLFTESNAAGLALLVFHVIMAAALWKMAERTKEEPKWFALVPILNLALFLKIAKKPLWWLLLFFIPLVNFVTLVVASMALCERFRVNKWWGLLSLVSPLNMGLYLYLAYWTEKPPSVPVVPPTAPQI